MGRRLRSQEVARYRRQIVESVVPVVHKLLEQKKGILGLDHLYFYDVINFKEGDPKPKVAPEEMVSVAQRMYHELSPEIGKFFDLMVEEELLDLVNREGKMPGGFCTSFPSYKRPDVFSNFNATDQDVLVLTHEIGHAHQSYAKESALIGFLATAEVMEIHSASMVDDLGLDGLFQRELNGSSTSILRHSFLSPYGACVDHFQHWVFEHPQATPKSARSTARTGPSIFPIEITMTLYSLTWRFLASPTDTTVPFLLRDGTLAQTRAFQYWMRNEEDPVKTWESYENFVGRAGACSMD